MSTFIYIVDDDESLRSSLFALLSTRTNILIRNFRSGNEFVDNMNDIDPGVVLLDIHMPGLSGLDVLAHLRDADRGFCTVVLTGRGDVNTAVQAMNLGAIDFIEKPYDHVTLFRSIDVGIERLTKSSAASERHRSAKARFSTLSPREQEVLLHLIDGKANKSIALAIGLSPRTVEVHRSNLMSKLGIGSLTEAVRLAYAAGVLSDA